MYKLSHKSHCSTPTACDCVLGFAAWNSFSVVDCVVDSSLDCERVVTILGKNRNERTCISDPTRNEFQEHCCHPGAVTLGCASLINPSKSKKLCRE